MVRRENANACLSFLALLHNPLRNSWGASLKRTKLRDAQFSRPLLLRKRKYLHICEGRRIMDSVCTMASASWEELMGPEGHFLNDAAGEIIGLGSRFPGSWDEVFEQACEATMSAMEEGQMRMLIELRQNEEVGLGDRGQLIEKRRNAGIRAKRYERYSLRIAMGMCNVLLESYMSVGVGKRAKIYFNTNEQLASAQLMMGDYVGGWVEMEVLSNECKEDLWEDLSILITPTNQCGNPSRIEAVEMMHYHRSWESELKPLIVVNPDLVALSACAIFEHKRRLPMFMSDFVSCYYINPGAFLSESVTGAVLKCYPRKWEMYELRRHQNRGFRIVAEINDKPTCEDLMNAFCWQSEADHSSTLIR